MTPLKTKNLAAALLSVALVTTLSVPAFADDRTGDVTAGAEQTTSDANANSIGTKEFTGAIEPGDHFSVDTEIKADVKAPTAKVISVTLPSTMSIAIGTKYKDVSGVQTAVFDASSTHEVAATVKNASKGTAVDVSVASVTDSNPASLSTLLLKLAPTTSAPGATAGSELALTAGTPNASMVAGLPGLAEDGTGTPGEATLTLSTGMTDNGTVLTDLVGKNISIATTLKVALPTPAAP